MAAVRDGNHDALAGLLRRYSRLVFRVAADILRDGGEAEDVTQEVFLEVYRKAHLYDPSRGTVRVWFLQYAYHRTLRRKASLRRRAAYRGEPLDAVDALVDERPPRLTAEERRWVIRAGLSHLPARQRAALELTCFEDLSLRDVAARLGVSLGCARHYYYRGLTRLREWARLVNPASADRCGHAQSVPLQQTIQLMPRHAEVRRGPAPARPVAFERREYFGG
jgi:RNA polymerase sigma-70 factor (ECF subfamily)